MRTLKTESRIVKTYTLTMLDGEIRDHPYSRTGRRYQVELITVVKTDGNVSSVELRGPVLKKDGTSGQNFTFEKFYTDRNWPEWLRSVVGGLA